jgi:hypothetical protein
MVGRFLFAFLRLVGISDFGTCTRRRVRSVMRSSGVRLGFVRGFGVIISSSGPGAGVYGS